MIIGTCSGGGFLLLGLIAGFAIRTLTIKPITPDAPSNFSELRSEGKYRFISPLLECDNSEEFYADATKILEDNLNEKISELKKDTEISTASVYYQDMNNGPGWQ